MMDSNWEFYILWPIVLVAILYALSALAKFAIKVVDGSTAPFMSDYVAFMQEAERRGLDYPSAIDEWKVRQAMVELRNDASDAVRSDPKNWKMILDRCVDDAFKRLAASDPDLLPAFGQMIKGLSYGQILYPHEAKLVDADVATLMGGRPSVDQMAALRIVKSG